MADVSKIRTPPSPPPTPPTLSVWRAAQALIEDPKLADAFRTAHDVEHPGKTGQAVGDDFGAIYDRALKGYQISVTAPLVNALATVAGADGVIDGADWKKLGPRFSPLALQLAEKAKTARPATGRDTERLFDGVTDATRQALAATTENLAPLSTMPVLAVLATATEQQRPLAGHRLFAVQHLFSSTYGLFEALEKAGIDPQHAVVFGKDYSTNAEVAAAMSAKGYTVHGHYAQKVPVLKDNKIVGLESPLLSGFRKALEEAAAASPPQKLLLLDEGGKLNRMLHDVFPQHARLCTIVEQTTNGLQNMAGVTLQAPTVSVASSALKREVEGPIIGEDVAATTLEQIARLGDNLATGKTVGIVGYGAVGSATAEAFAKRGFAVVVTDINPQAELKARAKTLTTAAGGTIRVRPREEVLAAGIVVGCTGTGAMTEAEMALVKNGAFLVNAASGDHEFPLTTTKAAKRQGIHADHSAMKDWQSNIDKAAVDLANPNNGPIVRTQFIGPGYVELDVPAASYDGERLVHPFPRGDGTTVDVSADNTGNLKNLYFQRGDKTFALLRGGTPVNMDRDLPPLSIQLTRSMLFAACTQAVAEDRPGWKTFSEATQKLIETNWRATALPALQG